MRDFEEEDRQILHFVDRALFILPHLNNSAASGLRTGAI
jgi:hypothetical protein